MTYQDHNDRHNSRNGAREPGGLPHQGEHGETVVTPVEARQGGRQLMSIHVLIASMVLVLLAFFTMWFFFTLRP